MEQEILLEKKAMKKSLKRDANWVGWGLIFYNLIAMFVVIGDALCRVIILMIREMRHPELAVDIDAYMNAYMEKATSSIIGVVLGVLFLMLFFRNRVTMKDIFVTNGKLTMSGFLQIMCVFLGLQLVFSGLDIVLEAGLNLIGYSAKDSIEQATSQSTTLSMFLYASFVAPIVEEVVYRGFVLKNLQKHGKLPAIIISAILFGVMHSNLPQGIYAFGVGVVLGYVAVEYSVVWSILLHMINNFLLADMLGRVTAGLGEQTQEIIEYAVIFIFFVLGTVFAWRKRRQIKEYVTANREPGKKYLYILTAFAMIIFIGAETALAIWQLTPL